MGSWTETCFISNLPIRQGDKCILFLFRESVDVQLGIYHCLNMININKYSERTISLFEKIINDDSLINSSSVASLHQYIEDTTKPFVKIYIGNYNDYGSVIGLDMDVDCDTAVLCRYDVARETVPSLLDGTYDGLELDYINLPVDIGYDILLWAQSHNRDFNKYVGMQYPDADNLYQIVKLLEISLEIAKKMYKDIKYEESEDD